MDDVHHALLRVVYRLLFTFVAEDRGALLDPAADPQARQRYRDYFSTERLRRTSRRRRGGRYNDKWQALTLVWRGLGDENGLPELALPGIGGLFEAGELDFLLDCAVSNEALQSAVRSLSLVREPGSHVLRVVDYRNLGAEELGSIYEALLEFVPRWDSATKIYDLSIASGNQRKDTGSYYTPTSLVESLLDTALDPVLDDAQKSANPEEALLGLTVCDPACGSGHFLVGAARRIAKRVAGIRTGDPEPAPEAVRAAMREVTARCIYGVDVNPLAAELAKVSLWLEALDPGRPLTFLDAQIKVGNALVGVTPKLLVDGLPNDAFKAIEGDDSSIAAALTRQNRAERSAQGSLFDIDMVAVSTKLAQQVQNVVAAPTLSLADVHVQQQRLRAYADSTEYRSQRLAADAWCAAFVWPKHAGAPTAITHRSIGALADGENPLSEETREEVDRLAAEYRFFHWHLEFPHLFPPSAIGDDTVNPITGWAGGFSVVIGNPPWEQIELKEQEYFDARDPDIAKAAGAKRKKLIAELIAADGPLAREYLAEKRRIDGMRHFAADSGRYPLCGRGRIKTDPLFAEAGRNLLAGYGRFGLILPTGIATDATTQFYFKDLVVNSSIASLYDFENRKPLFEAVDSRFKFCLLTLVGRDTHEPEADFAFFAHDPSDLQRPGARFTLTPKEITLLNPNTGTCPVFRTRRDAEITLSIYSRVKVLVRDGDPGANPWGIKFMQGLFNMTSDSGLFHTRDDLESEGWVLNRNVFERGEDRMLPLYESKMIHQFDPRWASYERDGSIRDATIEEKRDPDFAVMPRYWVANRETTQRLSESDLKSMFAWRGIARTTDVRTAIGCVAPPFPGGGNFDIVLGLSGSQLGAFAAGFSSFVFDFVVRQKLSNMHLQFSVVKQLPMISPDSIKNVAPWTNGQAIEQWCADRESRLRSDWDCDRMSVRAELDAAFFHLYGIERDDVDYIMETFPIVKRKDVTAHGEYRTKRLILEIYDAMAEAERTGVPYASPFDAAADS
ncbi:Eco57I restriction-modification methylase domain-containing protein [Mycolicibacterium sp.]|uniref:Eco57I restriction-modification methylase domain-containing protein n=1 Tax=Mycolicibacterium sp. TaxID=2320850 RepID=UPI0037C7FA46